MEYKVVSARSVEELELKVNEMMDDDWEPEGNLAVSGDNENFYQAMILYDYEDQMPDDDDDF